MSIYKIHIHFSLFCKNIDNNFRYLYYAANFIKLAVMNNIKQYGMYYIIHTDKNTYNYLMQIIHQEKICIDDIKFVFHDELVGLDGMLWRYEAFLDKTCDIACVGEIDSYFVYPFATISELTLFNNMQFDGINVIYNSINEYRHFGGQPIAIKPNKIKAQDYNVIRQLLNKFYVTCIDYGSDEAVVLPAIFDILKDYKLINVVYNLTLDQYISQYQTYFKNSKPIFGLHDSKFYIQTTDIDLQYFNINTQQYQLNDKVFKITDVYRG